MRLTASWEYSEPSTARRSFIRPPTEGSSEAKLPKQGALLFLVNLHAFQNVSEGADAGDGIWPFVEHDALGAFAHGCVGDLRAQWHALLCQGFENLRGPNYGNVGSLANPKNFFLDLRKPLIAAFHSEIAAGNHDSETTSAHGAENEFGQIVESSASLNLEDQSQVLPA